VIQSLLVKNPNFVKLNMIIFIRNSNMQKKIDLKNVIKCMSHGTFNMQWEFLTFLESGSQFMVL